MLVHLDLFSGIGGCALACEWAGIETIGFVEIDKYCQKVLRKHWPDVPIVEEIRDVEKIKEIVANTQKAKCKEPGYTRSRRSSFTDNNIDERTRATNLKPSVTLITAGFPCQPFSVAGKREGERDDRYLWPQTLTVIKEIKPKWVLLENVTGIISLALDTVLSDLEGAGYSYETLIIPACAVNAPHRRDRIWIVAYSDNGGWGQLFQQKQKYRGFSQTNSRGNGEIQSLANTKGRQPWEQTEQEGGQGSGRGSKKDVALPASNRGKTGLSGQEQGEERESREPINDSEISSHAAGEGLQRQRVKHKLREVSAEAKTAGCSWWAVEPELGRVAHGISHRVDRLKCLGNAIVPQVAYEIIKVIKEVDE